MAETLQFQMTVKTDYLEDFKEEIIDIGDETVLEPGCLRFEVWQHGANPEQFVMIEEYSDTSALDAHLSTPHYKQWRASTTAMIEKSEQLTQYEPGKGDMLVYP